MYAQYRCYDVSHVVSFNSCVSSNSLKFLFCIEIMLYVLNMINIVVCQGDMLGEWTYYLVFDEVDAIKAI